MEHVKEIQEWYDKANNGMVLFDASTGVRFAIYTGYLLNENKILHIALQALTTPLEYKAIMLEIKSLRQTNKED